MTPLQRLVAAAVLFFAATIVKYWGSEIGGAARGGWDHGRAQAAAEYRRASQAVRGRTRRPAGAGGTGGRSGGGLGRAAATARRIPQAARAIRAGMRGPRPGSAPGSSIPPGSGPAGRIGRAVAAGARLGARQARGIAGAATATARGLRGRAARLRPHRRPRVRSGVCDSCGRIAAGTSLIRTPVQTPGGQQLWLLCGLCRLFFSSWPGAAAPPAAPGPAAGERPHLPAEPAAPSPEALPGGTAPGQQARPAPALPAPGPALAPVNPESGPALAGAGAAARPALLTGGSPPMAAGEIARRRPAALTGRVIPAGTAVAVRDTTTHGDWIANVTQVIQALQVISYHQQLMLGGLTTANASRSQITDIRNWSAQADSARQVIRAWLTRTDSRLGPLIDQIEAAGGVEEIADLGYFADI